MRFIIQLTRFWLLFVLIAATGYIAIYNKETVPVVLPGLIQQNHFPAYAVFAASAIFGATITVLFFGLDYLKRAVEIRKLKKRIAELESITSSSSPDLYSRESSTGDSTPPVLSHRSQNEAPLPS